MHSKPAHALLVRVLLASIKGKLGRPVKAGTATKLHRAVDNPKWWNPHLHVDTSDDGSSSASNAVAVHAAVWSVLQVLLVTATQAKVQQAQAAPQAHGPQSLPPQRTCSKAAVTGT